MVGLKKELSLGIAGLSLVFGSVLCSQNQKFSETKNNENLENKAINYSIEDTIKIYESENILSKRKEFVENAKKYLGKEWVWGGRLTKQNPGLDCLGLIFLPYAKTFNKKWTEISVNPSEIVKKEQLGKPVEKLEGILNKDIDFSKLKEGDIIYLLLKERKIDDEPLVEIDGKRYWPWHTGIYSNKEKGLLLHAKPSNKVIEENFKEYLQETSDGIFVTRIY